MKSTLSLALLALFAHAAFAGLVKYKDWPSSPQAYFMTKAERAQWAAIKTDDEAEKFVNDFLAKRGAGFAEEVADRATNADKYLTIGKSRPASKTLRGKVIVLLGPPSGIKTETKKGRVDRSSTVGGYMAAIGSDATANGGGGTSVGEMIQVADQSGMSGHRSYVEYSITYSGDKLPPAYAKGITITVQADPVSGDDWAPDYRSEKQLNELFEAVAEARIAAAKP